VRQADILSADFVLYFFSGLQTRWAHRLESLCSVSGSYNRFRQKHFGSIFGTAISQARNKFGRDNFIHRTLIDTASVAYSPRKIVGTEGA
jgi:hypothetical protein